MYKNFFNIYSILILLLLVTISCGKKGELENPENNKSYPKEYPSE